MRTLLIHGACAALLPNTYARTPPCLPQWALATQAHIGPSKAAVALVNRLVRISGAFGATNDASAQPAARLPASGLINGGCGGTQHCRNGQVLQRSKADNNHDSGDRLSAWPPLRELQNGQGIAPKKGRIYACNRTDGRAGQKRCPLLVERVHIRIVRPLTRDSRLLLL